MSQLGSWCRSFGTYESKLWDDVFSEFEPITSDDIILVNFAAWYPKYKITEPYVPYEQWEESMAGMSRSALPTLQTFPLDAVQAEHASRARQVKIVVDA